MTVTLTTVPCDPEVVVTVTADVVKRCPFKDDELDHGTVTLSWLTTTNAATFELHQLRAYLDGFANVQISHEAFTRDLADELAGLFEAPCEVSSTWKTAGMAVTVTAP